PHVNYDAALTTGNCFCKTLILADTDYTNWSPYNETLTTSNPAGAAAMYPDGALWAQSTTSLPQSGFSTPTTNLSPAPGTAVYANLMKILLRVNWPKSRSGAGLRTFWLMTYKAQLQ